MVFYNRFLKYLSRLRIVQNLIYGLGKLLGTVQLD